MTTMTATRPQAQFFNLKSQFLSQGRLDNIVATTPLLSVVVKVYASGGENAMHMHANEDHSFIVLQGQATFRINSDDNIKVVNKNEGVMLPRGVLYWFQSSAAENLVMLRVGGGVRNVKGLDDLTPFGAPKDVTKQTGFADGSTKVGDDPRNGETAKKRIYAKGKFFAPS